MARDFSAVGSTGSTTSATGSASGSPGSGLFGLPKWVLAMIAAAVAFVVVIAVVVLTSGGSESSTDDGADAIRAAHGPTTTIDGVPAGYTRDQEGAQTAAVNFIQANGQTYEGRIDAKRLREVAVASSPTPALTEVIDISSDREDTGSTVNNVPLIVTVTEFSQDKAVVSEWGMGIGQTPVSDGSDKVGILTVYSTSTVTMVWENDDWKAQDWKFQTGPTAEQAQFPAADSPLSKRGAGGFYTFYVN
ncbi:hypothetical protein [Rhodococcoides fascians]|uniref:hypothetical protein n=1 Tax=Rhodococcoides fascians TaxID=1828 RepID=UPI00056C032D|nr:hypothetical protein [Rhodococcus fascians]